MESKQYSFCARLNTNWYCSPFNQSMESWAGLWLGNLSDDMKKKLGIALFIFAGLWIYRTEFFNLMVEYKPNTELETVSLNQSEVSKSVDEIIESDGYVGFVELNKLLLKNTTSNLEFSQEQNFNNINELKGLGRAHCVGYASYHTSVLNYAVERMNSEYYSIDHVRGSIHFLGIDLSKLTNNPFFQDHDFIRIRNNNLDKEYFCDPSLFEFLRIDRIKLKNGI